MSEAAKTLRLSKVAKEFNLSLGKIVEFLSTKGHKVENNPNAKIGDEEYGLLMAASVLALLPVIVFFLLIQRRFVEGVATTGIK